VAVEGNSNTIIKIGCSWQGVIHITLGNRICKLLGRFRGFNQSCSLPGLSAVRFRTGVIVAAVPLLRIASTKLALVTDGLRQSIDGALV